MNQHAWTLAVMKADLLPFRVGDPIVIGKSTLKFSHATIGEGYWILHRTENLCFLVADGDPSMGSGLNKLVRREGKVPDNKQDRCTARAKELMPNSAYHPRNRARMTYFFGGKPDVHKETEWKYD